MTPFESLSAIILHYTFAKEEDVKEILIKLITFMVRQAHHERNQYITVRPEPVEGLNQRLLQ